MLAFLTFLTLLGQISNSFGMVGFRCIPNGTVTYIYKTSPAEKVGLMVGDRVLSANGEKGVNAVDGDAGSQVSLTIRRGNDIMTFVITRVNKHEFR